MNTHPTSHDWGERLPTLLTQRLELRWLEPADAPEVLTVFGDPEVIRYWAGPGVSNESDARRLIEDIHRRFHFRDLFQWGIARRSEPGVIGTCTLFHPDLLHRRATVGYALGRAHWGQGYMTEALGALIGFALGTLSLHRLEADVDPRNLASLRTLERQGFRREGLLRERYFVGTEIQDSVWMGLLAREWRLRPDDGNGPDNYGPDRTR